MLKEQFSFCSALSIDEVRGRGSPNRESQHTSQGLLGDVHSLSLSVTGCDRAGFTFACSEGARGDQSLHRRMNIYIYRGGLQQND